MRSAQTHQAPRRARYLLSAATVTCAVPGATGLTVSSAASIPPPGHGAALRTSLRDDISQYLATRGTAEHISAISLRLTFPGRAAGIDLAAGTNQYGGGSPVSPAELWPIGSNTKAFTTAILLQLKAEGKQRRGGVRPYEGDRGGQDSTDVLPCATGR